MATSDHALVDLPPIRTPGKPGYLCDLDVRAICAGFGVTFTITKCFYINDLDSNLPRGGHSNMNAAEAVVCLRGSCNVFLHNRQSGTHITLVENQLLYIREDSWIELDKFEDCTLLVFVDIRDDSGKRRCDNFDTYIASQGSITFSSEMGRISQGTFA